MFPGLLAFLRVLVSLTFVLFLAYWCTRYLLPRLQTGPAGRQTAMRVIERLPVGVRSTLCLVRVGERCFLIGVTPAGIATLAEIDPAQIPDGFDPAQGQPDFAKLLALSKEKVLIWGRSRAGRAGGAKELIKRGNADEHQENRHDS